MDVVQAAWSAPGTPAPAHGDQGGACARCGQHSWSLTPTRKVVSRNFTAYDRWRHPAGTVLCAGCAWGYLHTPLRQQPHLINRDPARLTPMTTAQTLQVLLTRPIQPDQALVVPLRRARKHLAPEACWGRVTTDHGALPWTDLEQRLLQATQQLRAAGFPTAALREPAPPYRALRRHPTQQWPQLIALWDLLRPWRRPNSPWMPLAIHVTTPPKEKS